MLLAPPAFPHSRPARAVEASAEGGGGGGTAIAAASSRTTTTTAAVQYVNAAQGYSVDVPPQWEKIDKVGDECGVDGGDAG